jgi:hypothetical protein
LLETIPSTIESITLLEKMAHFSSVITYGAGRSLQWAIFSLPGEGKLSAILIHAEKQCCHGPNFGRRNSVLGLVRIRPKGLGQIKKSGSDLNILYPTESGSLTLSRNQNGLFKNLCGQKNCRIFLIIVKKVSTMDQNFLKIYIIFRIFWPKILVRGVGNIANPKGLRISLFVADVHSDPLWSASGQWHRDSRDSIHLPPYM